MFYLRGTQLGPDVQPYIGPVKASLKTPLWAEDAAGSGALAIQLEPGDVVTVDETLSDRYTGLYEITIDNTTLTGSEAGQGADRSAQPGGKSFTLRPYDPNNYPDTSPTDQPGIPDVPCIPGGSTSSTDIPLADGGTLAFFSGSGSGATGRTFQLPPGFLGTNLLAWASPQGYADGSLHLHFVQDCDAYNTRQLTLIYNDSDGNTWNGDVNFAGITWRSATSVRQLDTSNMTGWEFTVAGGETVWFGKSSGPIGPATPQQPPSFGNDPLIQFPAGYSVGRSVSLALPKTGVDVGLLTDGLACYVDATGAPHFVFDGDQGNPWESYPNVFVCAYANNMGSWEDTGTGWRRCTLATGQVFAIGGFSILDPNMGGVRPSIYGSGSLAEVLTGGIVPACPGMTSATFQSMCVSNGFQNINQPAHGVRQCMVDSSLNATCSFQDGSGNVWYGSTAVFGLLCDTSTG